jgi:hypothetical protein
MDGLDHAAPAAGRGPRGRFAPGQSGNPGGRKPGSRNWATRLREHLAEGDDALAVRVLVDEARDGNGVAARFLLDRLFPKPRDRDIDLELPADAAPADMVDRILRLMAAGDINVDEAGRMIRLIQAGRDQFGVARAPAEAETVSPAFDLQTAGETSDEAAPAAPPPRPLNRHERRRAAALARTAPPPPPMPAAA